MHYNDVHGAPPLELTGAPLENTKTVPIDIDTSGEKPFTSRPRLASVSQAISDFNMSLQNTKPKYKIMEELGRGKFGVVYRAQHKLTNRIVAIKVVKLRKKAIAEAVVKEVAVLQKLQHKNIIRLIETFYEGTMINRKVSVEGDQKREKEREEEKKWCMIVM
jgi:serine/threonine protein kinase